MYRIITAILIAGIFLCVFPAVSSALAHQSNALAICTQSFTQTKHNKYVRHVLTKRGPVSKRSLKRMRMMRLCQHSPAAQINAHKFYIKWSKIRQKLKQIWAITPYNCSGDWYAIPCAIVNCEGGVGNWNKMNSSGSSAYGPYQLLGWVPIPSPPSVQHRMAAKLWNGGAGRHHWDASAGCWGGKV